jgi:hypothetical protein
MRYAYFSSLFVFFCFCAAPVIAAEKKCSDLGDPALCYEQFAKAITSTFPRLDADQPNGPSPASVGTNWCFEIETDPTTNWWYFTRKGKTYAHSADAGVRIKATYQMPTTGEIAFASIFLAIDLLKSSDYVDPSFDNHRPNQADIDPGPPDIGKGSTIDIPTQNTACPQFGYFLKTALPSYLGTWVLIDEPFCGDSCGSSDLPINGKIVKVDNVQESDATRAYPLYWRFNAITHTISGAMRFVVKFTTGPYKDKFGVLWVGYGGAGSGG